LSGLHSQLRFDLGESAFKLTEVIGVVV
jgi:hypothetical protein